MARQKEFDPDEALDRAMHLFWEQGYGNTSMRDLVKATGVAPAGLYSEFGSKEGLYKRASQRYRDEYFGRLIAELLSETAGIEEIRIVFERLHQRIQTFRRGVGCFWVNGAVEFTGRRPEMVSLFQWNAKRMDREFQRALRNSADRGDWDSDLPIPIAAAELVGIFNGILVLARGEADKDLIDRSVDGALRLLNS